MGTSPDPSRPDEVDGRHDREPHLEDLATLLRDQNGRVRRDQLVAHRMAESHIDSWVKRDRLIVKERGIYAVGHDAPSELADWRTAVLAGGEDAVLSHLPGMVHWRFAAIPGLVPHVTIRGPRKQRRGLVWHWGAIEADERMEVRGLPVTSPIRTFRDCAPLLHRDRLERALDAADWAIKHDPTTFDELFARYPRHPGCRILRLVFADRVDGRTRSWLERRFKPISRRLSVQPLRNHRIDLPGRVIEGDCVWLLQMLIVELDGRTYHERQAAFESDRARDRAAARAGYLTIRITWGQLRDDPEGVLADIDAILSARTPSR